MRDDFWLILFAVHVRAKGIVSHLGSYVGFEVNTFERRCVDCHFD
jgi:hypothetical protein